MPAMSCHSGSLCVRAWSSALFAAFSMAAFAVPASAKEYPIGTPQTQAGMEIGAVYLQPIEMDPPDMMRAANGSDVHLEADIKAAKNNPNGFSEGDWVPYLGVKFELKKDGSTETRSGEMMAMVANDGPHYGDNVKLMGPGKYTLILTVAPPMHFGRHVDKETGVGPWFKPLTLTYDFVFAGTGKKGAY